MENTLKVIVTGGAGYIGSHTVIELINDGFEPIIIDDFSNSQRWIIDHLTQLSGRTIKVYEETCQDLEKMRQIFRIEKNVHGIIHFAAFKSVSESVKRPLEYYDNNIGSLATMLKIKAEFNVSKFVFSSSCTVYGQADELPVTEKTAIKKAESPYGYTKQVGEQMVWDACDEGAILLRYFNPVGAHPSGLLGELPNGKPENLLPYITQTAAGIREKLTVFGDDYDTPDGTCIRDYIHVVDLAKSHVAALKRLDKNPFTDVFNVGTGRGNSVLEAIKTFEQVNGLRLNYEISGRRAGDIEQIYADTSKAQSLLDWSPEFTLADALSHAWKWEKSLRQTKSAPYSHTGNLRTKLTIQ